jgi:hypothetical protein
MAAAPSQNFDAFYAREIRPVLKKLERKRKIVLAKIGTLLVVLALLICATAVVLFIVRVHPAFAAIGILPALIIAVVSTHFLARDYYPLPRTGLQAPVQEAHHLGRGSVL